MRGLVRGEVPGTVRAWVRLCRLRGKGAPACAGLNPSRAGAGERGTCSRFVREWRYRCRLVGRRERGLGIASCRCVSRGRRAVSGSGQRSRRALPACGRRLALGLVKPADGWARGTASTCRAGRPRPCSKAGSKAGSEAVLALTNALVKDETLVCFAGHAPGQFGSGGSWVTKEIRLPRGVHEARTADGSSPESATITYETRCPGVGSGVVHGSAGRREPCAHLEAGAGDGVLLEAAELEPDEDLLSPDFDEFAGAEEGVADDVEEDERLSVL